MRIACPWLLLVAAPFVASCTSDSALPDLETDGSGSTGGSEQPGNPWAVLEESAWRLGDPTAGLDAIRYGSNTGGGIPLEIMVGLFGGAAFDNRLDRSGDSTMVPYSFNVYEAPNGVAVTAPSCLSCHASVRNGQLVVGLGNVFADLAGSSSQLGIIRLQIENTYGADSPEMEAFTPYFRGFTAAAGFADPPIPGINPAFALEAAAMAHRDPVSFAWHDDARYPKRTEVTVSDVPPLWNLAKKNALYYNGMGRGDAARLLMQSSMVASPGVDHLQSVDATMPDMLAYLVALQPPPYPSEIDAALAETGRPLFEAHCSSCHGTYGAQETYPNLLVDLEHVGTDPVYAQRLVERQSELIADYNNGWFGASDPPSTLEPTLGYVAPPLDGVWATAPYLHNGSVPTLAGVLDSTQRPAVWLRDFEGQSYDDQAPGLVFEAVPSGTPDAYDTTVPGFGNQGHLFGDALSPQQTAAIVAYLKTL